jgi:hypothetical protein
MLPSADHLQHYSNVLVPFLGQIVQGIHDPDILEHDPAQIVMLIGLRRLSVLYGYPDWGTVEPFALECDWLTAQGQIILVRHSLESLMTMLDAAGD